MNKLYQELNNNQLRNNLQTLSNPKSYVKSMMNNPQLKAVINKYGNPKKAFYSIAQEKGINPDEIINMISNLGNYK